MDAETKMLVQLADEEDWETRNKAFLLLIETVNKKVDWAYEVWDKLVDDLSSSNMELRLRAGQLLSYLAISDSEQRILEIFPEIWDITYDLDYESSLDLFQSTWKIGLAGAEQKNILFQAYEERFQETLKDSENNNELVRFYILKNLMKLYEQLQDKKTENLIQKLLYLESENRYKVNCQVYIQTYISR